MDCILIRHGQTAWNQEERFRGRADLPLNPLGIEQADRVARALRGEPIAAIYASRLQRAMCTAAPLAATLALPVTPHDGLLDIDVGDWEGLSPSEVSARWPELYAAWVAAPQTVRIPGGESLGDVRARLQSMLKELYARHAGQQIALVSHQAVNKVLLLVALGLDDSAFWRLVQTNAGISRFSLRDGEYVVRSMNETRHLRDQ